MRASEGHFERIDFVGFTPPPNDDGPIPRTVAAISADAANWQNRLNAMIGPQYGTTSSANTSAGAPTISSVSPQVGAPGDAVTIIGANLTGTTAVDFGGVNAPFTVISSTQISTIVPQGAASGSVRVTTSAGSVSSAFSTGTANQYGGDATYGAGGSGGGGGGGGLDADDIDWGDAGADGGDLEDSDIDWGDGSIPDEFDDRPEVLGDAPWRTGSYYFLGVDTIPSAVSYIDHDTVMAVQSALKQKGYDPGKLDGVFGPKTSAAIRKMQADAGVGSTGVVDYGVLMALGVRAPAYTPTTTTAGRSASAAAQDAAEIASHAETPAAVRAASQQVEAANAVALPPPPPEVQTKVAQAAAAARAAQTPAEAKAAALQVQDAAKAVASATSFWGRPLWQGAPVKRWQGAVGLGAGAAVTVALALMARRR